MNIKKIKEHNPQSFLEDLKRVREIMVYTGHTNSYYKILKHELLRDAEEKAITYYITDSIFARKRDGHNTAFDCCECGADEFKEGFITGADWQARQSPWISVEERLPEKNTVVLTRGAYGFLICQLSSLGEWETGANVNKERLGITHWMPIPSFDEILEANKDVLERIKEKGVKNEIS